MSRRVRPRGAAGRGQKMDERFYSCRALGLWSAGQDVWHRGARFGGLRIGQKSEEILRFYAAADGVEDRGRFAIDFARERWSGLVATGAVQFAQKQLARGDVYLVDICVNALVAKDAGWCVVGVRVQC